MANNTSPVLVAAREYFLKGWAPIPIPLGKKAPRLNGWQNLRLAVDDLVYHFQKACNIGILLGELSGGLVDVDLDALEALAVADVFLPSTDRIHGRLSKPRSHRRYACAESPQPARFTDADGTCLVELRSAGQQTIVPPSIHPSGEPTNWEC